MRDLEIRQEWSGTSLEMRQSRESGAAEFRLWFPYGLDNVATISDRGTVRKEYFVSRAFRFAVENKERDIAVLRGHDWNQILGTKHANNAKFNDTVRGFETLLELPPSSEQTWAQQQFVKEFAQHLLRGVSPGFRIPPPTAVRDATRLVPEPGNPAVQMREIRQAVIHEISPVGRPAYKSTNIEQRSESLESNDDWKYRRKLWL